MLFLCCHNYRHNKPHHPLPLLEEEGNREKPMSVLQEQLKEIGLDGDEGAVYAAALELGPATVLEIARKTGLNRTTLYAVTDRLIEKRLLAKSPNGKRTVFAAEPPEKLALLLKEKLAKLDDLLPELMLLGRKGTVKPKMKYYEGLEGIKTIYRDSLQSNDKTLYAFVGVERLNVHSKALNAFWENEYITGRKNKNIHGKLIIPDNAEGRAFKAKDETSNRECRLVPASNYNFEGEVLLYDDVVCFVSYTEDEEFALSLESKSIAKTLRMIWQIVWNAGY